VTGSCVPRDDPGVAKVKLTSRSGPANTARREGERSVPVAILTATPRALARHLGEHASFHGSTSTLLIRNLLPSYT
jgi:hypothetical protein